MLATYPIPDLWAFPPLLMLPSKSARSSCHCSVLGKLRQTKTKGSPHSPTEASEKVRPLAQSCLQHPCTTTAPWCLVSRASSSLWRHAGTQPALLKQAGLCPLSRLLRTFIRWHCQSSLVPSRSMWDASPCISQTLRHIYPPHYPGSSNLSSLTAVQQPNYKALTFN